MLVATCAPVATAGGPVPHPADATRDAASAPKTTFTADLTDVWWPNDEPGWGIQFVHNADWVFATLYVYDASNRPTFYVSLLANAPTGSPVWTGALSTASGPWFGAPFDPAAVVETFVGAMTFTLTDFATGTLAYTVDGTSVSKTIHRQPLKLENNTGYYSRVHTRWTAAGATCDDDDFRSPASPKGLNITQATAVADVVFDYWTGNADSCHAHGASYTQVGRYGRYDGAFACTNGRSGTMTLYETVNRIFILTGRYSLVWDDGCKHNGWFTAMM